MAGWRAPEPGSCSVHEVRSLWRERQTEAMMQPQSETEGLKGPWGAAGTSPHSEPEEPGV